jgi:hypothetical protein
LFVVVCCCCCCCCCLFVCCSRCRLRFCFTHGSLM